MAPQQAQGQSKYANSSNGKEIKSVKQQKDDVSLIDIYCIASFNEFKDKIIRWVILTVPGALGTQIAVVMQMVDCISTN